MKELRVEFGGDVSVCTLFSSSRSRCARSARNAASSSSFSLPVLFCRFFSCLWLCRFLDFDFDLPSNIRSISNCKWCDRSYDASVSDRGRSSTTSPTMTRNSQRKSTPATRKNVIVVSSVVSDCDAVFASLTRTSPPRLPRVMLRRPSWAVVESWASRGACSLSTADLPLSSSSLPAILRMTAFPSVWGHLPTTASALLHVSESDTHT